MASVSRSIHRLSSKATVAKRLPGYYADGAGLYLQVAASAARGERGVEAGTSARSWIFRFDLNQRRREMGLGPLSIVSLAEARSRAAECRKLLHEGKDPLAMRKPRKVKEKHKPRQRNRCEALINVQRPTLRRTGQGGAAPSTRSSGNKRYANTQHPSSENCPSAR